jgi:hypothetical protein
MFRVFTARRLYKSFGVKGLKRSLNIYVWQIAARSCRHGNEHSGSIKNGKTWVTQRLLKTFFQWVWLDEEEEDKH